MSLPTTLGCVVPAGLAPPNVSACVTRVARGGIAVWVFGGDRQVVVDARSRRRGGRRQVQAGGSTRRDRDVAGNASDGLRARVRHRHGLASRRLQCDGEHVNPAIACREHVIGRKNGLAVSCSLRHRARVSRIGTRLESWAVTVILIVPASRRAGVVRHDREPVRRGGCRRGGEDQRPTSRPRTCEGEQPRWAAAELHARNEPSPETAAAACRLPPFSTRKWSAGSINAQSANVKRRDVFRISRTSLPGVELADRLEPRTEAEQQPVGLHRRARGEKEDDAVLRRDDLLDHVAVEVPHLHRVRSGRDDVPGRPRPAPTSPRPPTEARGIDRRAAGARGAGAPLARRACRDARARAGARRGGAGPRSPPGARSRRLRR